MVKDDDDKGQKIQKQFEEILPRLWSKARENEAKMKSEYLSTLHTKLLEEIKTQISTPSFETWFSGLSIEDVKDDNSIIFGTTTTIAKEWIEQVYITLIEKSLKFVTNTDFKAYFVIRVKEKSDCEYEKPFTIDQCVICKCKDFQSKNIEIPLGIQGIVSMTVEGFKCRKCGEEYYSDTIKRVIQLFKQREYEQQIKPMHLQSEEYRKSSAKAARDDDDEDKQNTICD